MAMFVAWAIGLPVGMISAMKRNSLVDNVLRFIVTLFLAIAYHDAGWPLADNIDSRVAALIEKHRPA